MINRLLKKLSETISLNREEEAFFLTLISLDNEEFGGQIFENSKHAAYEENNILR